MKLNSKKCFYHQSATLDTLCATLKHSLGIDYDLAGYLRLLVFGRILDPASKIATASQNDRYLEPLVADASYPYHVYDVLDVLYEHKEKFIRRMNSNIQKKLGRNPQRIFYDVTNFFFEIQRPDDEEEVDGETVKGLRQKGVSKENRKEPIVQMGLFLDDQGIPITIKAFPGNTLDQATLRPALDKSLYNLDFGRYILVADRGMCSYKNIAHIVNNGHGYIMSKSIRKSKKDERKWILEPDGYVTVSEDFRYKSRLMERQVMDADGHKRTIKENIIVYWSRRFYNREYEEHKKFIDFMERLRQNPASFRITAVEAGKVRKYFKKEYVNKETGEIIRSGDLLGMLDEEKLEELTAYMGYYQLATSEIEMPPQEVIETYHGLTRIEDQFRVMKGSLETRPIHVRTREHISAHLLICVMALIMMRIIQKKIAACEKAADRKDVLWSYGMSGERLQEALRLWKAEALNGELYRFCDTDNEDLKRILDAFGIAIPRKLYTRGELRKLKSGIHPM